MTDINLPNIGIAGEAGSGKDTLAKQILLHHHEFTRRAFADQLKINVYRMIDDENTEEDDDYPEFEMEEIDYSDRNGWKNAFACRFARASYEHDNKVIAWIDNHKSDELMRSMLQTYGTFMREYEDKNYWIHAVTKWFAENSNYLEKEKLIIPDVRYPHEATALRAKGFLIVKVVRQNFDNKLTATQRNHSSEREIDEIYPSIIVYNDSTPEALYQDFLTQASILAQKHVPFDTDPLRR